MFDKSQKLDEVYLIFMVVLLLISVGIIRNKIPLVSNTLDSKYQSQQREVADGWYLVTCTTTPSKKKDMEKIASVLGLNVKVEEI